MVGLRGRSEAGERHKTSLSDAAPQAPASHAAAGLPLSPRWCTHLARFTEQGFDKLVLVAFSAGTVLARNFFSRAQGARVPGGGAAGIATEDGDWTGLPRLDPSLAKPWADKIERIIFLSGVTRGWSLSSATPATLRFLAPILLSFLNSSARLQGKKCSFIENFKRGAPFFDAAMT